MLRQSYLSLGELCSTVHSVQCTVCTLLHTTTQLGAHSRAVQLNFVGLKCNILAAGDTALLKRFLPPNLHKIVFLQYFTTSMCIAVHLNIESVWQQLTILYIGFLSLGVFLSAGKAQEYLDNYCYLSLSLPRKT